MPASKPGSKKAPVVQKRQRGCPQQDHGSSSNTPKDQQPLYPEAKGECLVVMRYRIEGDQRVRNAINRGAQIIKQYGGRCLGIADKVVVVEAPEGSEWLEKQDWCMCLLLFPSQQLARRWYDGHYEWHQHDFLTPPVGVQLFSIPVRFIPSWDKQKTFLWMEFEEMQNKDLFQQDFVDPVTKIFDTKAIDHGLVFIKDKDSDKIDRFKDCWLPPKNHYVLSIMDSEDLFLNLQDDAEYKKAVAKRTDVCYATSVLFTLNPKIN